MSNVYMLYCELSVFLSYQKCLEARKKGMGKAAWGSIALLALAVVGVGVFVAMKNR